MIALFFTINKFKELFRYICKVSQPHWLTLEEEGENAIYEYQHGGHFRGVHHRKSQKLSLTDSKLRW